jgi:hypothetical protein
MSQSKPSWKLRRRSIFGSLIFCGIIISYIIFFGKDTSVNETAIISAFGLIGAIIASYIGGAVWDDYNMKKISKDEE